MQGVWPATLSRGRFTVTVWYGDKFPDPVYKAKNHWTCQGLDDVKYCNYKKGDSVKFVDVFPLLFNGRSAVLPGSMFTSGWYKLQGRVYNDYDEEILCVEVSAYWVF